MSRPKKPKGHTPGPWRLDPTVNDLDPEGNDDGGFYARSVTAENGTGIAEVYWHGRKTDAETLANGRLIEAAPELLAALELVLEGKDAHGFRECIVPSFVRAKVEPLLARLRGGQT